MRLADSSLVPCYVILVIWLRGSPTFAKVVIKDENNDSPVLKVVYGIGNRHFFKEKGVIPQASDRDRKTCVDISENVSYQ